MEKYLALINKNIVQSVVVGCDDFIDHITGKYDYIIDVTNRDRPESGDSYYPEVDIFISNNATNIDLPTDLTAAHLQQGTDDGFEPFQLSKYTVTYNNGIVTIGCKNYPAAGLLNAAYEVLIEKQNNSSVFITSPNGPMHGKFGITWDDTQMLYDALIKVKF